MRLHGLYARLYSMQFRDPDEELAARAVHVNDKPIKEPVLAKRRSGLLGVLRPIS